MTRIHVRQTYLDPNRRERARGGFRPFDEADRVLEVRLQVAPLGRREPPEAKEVEMRHVRDAWVAVADGERRARHGPGHAESATRAADEGRLAAAQLARDSDDVSGAELARERRRYRFRLRRRGGAKLHAQNRPSWTAGSAATDASWGAATGAGSRTERPRSSGRREKSS